MAGNIREYNAEGLGLRPSETGADAFAMAGRRIGAFYSDMANDLKQTGAEIGSGIKAAGDAYVNYEDHKEIAAGAAAGTEMFSKLTDQWNSIAKGTDPNNSSVAGHFSENSLEPVLEKFQEGFTTEKSQEWAQQFTQKLRDHFSQKISADMSTRAGNAITQNIHQLSNSLSNSVRTDPSSLDFALGTIDHSLGTMIKTSPNILPEHATEIESKLGQEVKENIVKSAVWGAIEKNPEAGLKLASDPRYSKFISGQEVTQAEQYAKMQRSAADADKERAINLQEKEQKRASDAQKNSLLTKLGSDDPKEAAQVTAKGILEDKTMTPEDKVSMFRFVQQENKPESDAKVSQSAYNEILPRLYAPEGDPRKITSINELLDQKDKLTRADFNDLLKKFQDTTTDTGQKVTVMKQQLSAAVKDSILHVAGMSADNNEGLYRFNRFLDDKVAEYTRDNKDVSALFRPGSPEYLGSPAALSPFKKSLTQALQDKTNDISNTPSKGRPALPAGAPRNAQMMSVKGKYVPMVQNPKSATGWSIWEPD